MAPLVIYKRTNDTYLSIGESRSDKIADDEVLRSSLSELVDVLRGSLGRSAECAPVRTLRLL
jgi:hypothetical protein